MAQPVARPYAEALIQIGEETGLLDAFRENLDFLGEYLAQDKEFRAFIESPRIDRDIKRGVIRKAFGKKFEDQIISLLEILIEKSRQLVLLDIVDTYRELHDEKKGRAAVRLHTARPLDRRATRRIVAELAGTLEKEIVLEEVVEPTLLGGVVLHIGDTVVDGSLRRRLTALDKRMKTVGIDGAGFYED